MRHEHPRIMSATTLIGDRVRNPQGKDLGTLKEFMIDLSNGHIIYGVLSFGGFLGIGDKLFALPWESLTVDTENRCIVLDVTEEQLENAPGFDPDNWPESPDRQFIDRVYTHYGYEPYYDPTTGYPRQRVPRGLELEMAQPVGVGGNGSDRF